MRARVIFLALLTAAGPATGQQSWHAEFGIQGGYVRFDRAGVTTASDRTDFYDLPGGSLSDGGLAPGVFYAIVPLRGRVALEPSFSLFQATPRWISGTTVSVGLRADYSITPHLYAAAGGMLGRIDGATGGPPVDHATLVGLQVAAGYRMRLTSELRGRIEASVLTVAKNDYSGAYNVYAALIGISATAPVAAPRARSHPEGGRREPWTPALGIQGGYARVSVTGFRTWAQLSVPGAGAARLAGWTAATPATLFAVIPIRGKVAFEPALDVHQANSHGEACVSAQFAPRIDYAIGRWYAAAGPTMHVVKCRIVLGLNQVVGIAGAAAAWGYRFALPAGLGGRVEISYGATRERRDYPFPARVFSVTLGATAPLR